MEKRTNHIKVNFPMNERDWCRGNGEGMWVLVDDETKEAHDSDVSGGSWKGTLDNDSFFFPGLDHGAEVVFEMRGNYRPVAIEARIEDGGRTRLVYEKPCDL